MAGAQSGPMFSQYDPIVSTLSVCSLAFGNTGAGITADVGTRDEASLKLRWNFSPALATFHYERCIRHVIGCFLC